MKSVLSNLATSYEHQKQLKRAKKTYEKLLDIDQNAVEARQKLEKMSVPLAAKRRDKSHLAQKRVDETPTDDTVTCEQCGAKVERSATFCPGCGAVFGPSRSCSSCGAALPVDAKFCGRCGTTQEVSQRVCLRCAADNPPDAPR